MSINVDKMDSKRNDSLHKSKPVMKRRKKNSSTSDLSCDSLSPKKHIPNMPNSFADDEYRSSPDILSNAAYHSGLADSIATQNGHIVVNTTDQNDDLSDRDTNMLDTTNASSSSSSSASLSSSSSSSSSSSDDGGDSTPCANKSQRQPRTPEDFYLFCQFILEYANYNEMCDQETLRSSNNSPLDSTGSAAESTISSAVNDESNHAISNAVDADHKEISGKDSDDGSNAMVNENSPDELVKKTSAIDVSSTNEDDDSDIDAESYNLITCYCGKPYAARPMIECSRCLTWLHLSCAKIKRKKIPDIFICVKCAKSDQQSKQQSSQKQQQQQDQNEIAAIQTTPSSHPKGQSNEPKENNRSKKLITLNNSQIRTDKLETSILQPLNVSATAYETGANNLENMKTTTSVSSIAVKYK